jgi:hypothetical protein
LACRACAFALRERAGRLGCDLATALCGGVLIHEGAIGAREFGELGLGVLGHRRGTFANLMNFVMSVAHVSYSLARACASMAILERARFISDKRAHDNDRIGRKPGLVKLGPAGVTVGI